VSSIRAMEFRGFCGKEIRERGGCGGKKERTGSF
jgi:hypothetical protein